MFPLAHSNPQPKRHLDRLSRFHWPHYCDRPTDRPTDLTTWSVTISRIYLGLGIYVLSTALWSNNNNTARCSVPTAEILWGPPRSLKTFNWPSLAEFQAVHIPIKRGQLLNFDRTICRRLAISVLRSLIRISWSCRSTFWFLILIIMSYCEIFYSIFITSVP